MAQLDSNLPGSQAAALELLRERRDKKELISAAMLAQLVGKTPRTTFASLVDVWTTPAGGWTLLRDCIQLAQTLKTSSSLKNGDASLPLLTPGTPAPAAIELHAVQQHRHATVMQPHAVTQPFPQALPLQTDHRPESLILLGVDHVLPALMSNLKLGAGSFGSVYHGVVAGKPVAFKLPVSIPGALDAEMITSLLSKLQHENIVRLLGLGSFDPSDL